MNTIAFYIIGLTLVGAVLLFGFNALEFFEKERSSSNRVESSILLMIDYLSSESDGKVSDSLLKSVDTSIDYILHVEESSSDIYIPEIEGVVVFYDEALDEPILVECRSVFEAIVGVGEGLSEDLSDIHDKYINNEVTKVKIIPLIGSQFNSSSELISSMKNILSYNMNYPLSSGKLSLSNQMKPVITNDNNYELLNLLGLDVADLLSAEKSKASSEPSNLEDSDILRIRAEARRRAEEIVDEENTVESVERKLEKDNDVVYQGEQNEPSAPEEETMLSEDMYVKDSKTTITPDIVEKTPPKKRRVPLIQLMEQESNEDIVENKKDESSSESGEKERVDDIKPSESDIESEEAGDK